MPDPCKQEGPIASLRSDNANLVKTLEQIEENQKEFIRLLQEIAMQGEQIKTLFQRIGKVDTDIGAIFVRLRDVELAPGKQASALQVYGISAIIAGIITYASKKFGG